MRKLLTLLLLLLLLLTSSAMAAEKSAYRLADEQGTLLAWLDARKHPVFVLLPAAQYATLQHDWNLPERSR